MKKPTLTQKILQHLATCEAGATATAIAIAIGEADFEKNIATLVSNLKARRLVMAPTRGGYQITDLGRQHLAGILEDAAGVEKVAATERKPRPATTPTHPQREAAQAERIELVVDTTGRLLLIANGCVAHRLSPTDSADLAALILNTGPQKAPF